MSESSTLPNQCCLCEELKSDSSSRQPLEQNEKTIFRSQHFVVLRDISPIVPGHCLVLPRQHFTSFSQIPSEWWPELEGIKDQAISFLTKRFGDPFLFEHGSVPGMSGGGACIEHAHIHFIPKRISIVNKLQEFASTTINLQPIHMAKALQGIEGGYLFYQDQTGRGCVVENIKEPLPKQFIRMVVAEICGIREWNWKNMASHQDSTKVALICRQ